MGLNYRIAPPQEESTVLDALLFGILEGEEALMFSAIAILFGWMRAGAVCTGKRIGCAHLRCLL
jgi:hypothetical protein